MSGVGPRTIALLDVLHRFAPLDGILRNHPGADCVLQHSVKALPQTISRGWSIGHFVDDGVYVLRFEPSQRLRSMLFPKSLKDASVVTARAVCEVLYSAEP